MNNSIQKANEYLQKLIDKQENLPQLKATLQALQDALGISNVQLAEILQIPKSSLDKLLYKDQTAHAAVYLERIVERLIDLDLPISKIDKSFPYRRILLEMELQPNQLINLANEVYNITENVNDGYNLDDEPIELELMDGIKSSIFIGAISSETYCKEKGENVYAIGYSRTEGQFFLIVISYKENKASIFAARNVFELFEKVIQEENQDLASDGQFEKFSNVVLNELGGM